MRKDNVELVQPGELKDHFTEITKVHHSEEKLEDCRKRVMQHGHLPERKVVTGIRAIPVKIPRSRDRQKTPGSKLNSLYISITSPCVRRSKSVDMALPYLFERHLLRGFYRSYADSARQGHGRIFCGLCASIVETMERGTESMEESTIGDQKLRLHFRPE